MENLHEAQVSL